MFKELTCERCGKTFTGWETRRLCDECRAEHKRLIESARWQAKHTPEIRECKICGAKFTVDAHHRVYCCKEHAQQGKTELTRQYRQKK